MGQRAVYQRQQGESLPFPTSKDRKADRNAGQALITHMRMRGMAGTPILSFRDLLLLHCLQLRWELL